MMIKKEDLRIGNWVTCGRDVRKFVQVESIDETGINIEITGGYYAGEHEKDYDGYFDMRWHSSALIEPIPLNPEILEKAGFEVFDIGCLKRFTKGKLMVEMFIYNFRMSIRVRIDQNNSAYLTDIEYVHHLQNLYYSIENQELNITL